MIKKQKTLELVAKKLVTVTTPHSYAAEQFRTLRTNINFSSPDQVIKSLLVTSASPFEGKSTTAANLAVVFAQEGKKILLIDADMRKPTMHHTFKKDNASGLSTVLTKQTALEASIKKTNIERLDILTSGPIPPNPAELLASISLESMIRNLQEIYELIIFDSPPMLSVADGQILANKCGGALLVINSNKTEKQKALKAKEAIVASNGKLLGAILNNYKNPRHDTYYEYSWNSKEH